MSRFFSDSISAKSYIYFEVFWLIKHWFYYGWIILLGNHWKTRFVSLKSVLIWPSEVPNLFWKYQKSNVSDFSNRYWCPYFFLNPSDEKVSAIWSVVHVWPGFGNQKNVLISNKLRSRFGPGAAHKSAKTHQKVLHKRCQILPGQAFSDTMVEVSHSNVTRLRRDKSYYIYYKPYYTFFLVYYNL